MDKRPLRRLVIEGFMSIRKLDLSLGEINVLIGPNGAGKSNLFALFRMVSAMMDRRLGVFVGRAGGANALLHYGKKHTSAIRGELHFSDQCYRFGLVPTDEDAVVFDHEEVVLIRSEEKDRITVRLGTGHRETKVATPRDAGKVDHFDLASTINSWREYHFDDTGETAALKQSVDVHVNEYLRRDAANLSAYLYLLKQKYPDSYERIRSAVRLAVPKFGDFVLRPEPLNENKIRLKWQELGSDYPFLADQCSDGMLRFICLATVLLQPVEGMPATLAIDEPELGLHPAALAILGDMIHEAARCTQVIISTQSAALVDRFEPDDIITVDRVVGEEGGSIFRRHTTEELALWLNEYTLSEVWEMNVIGGRP